MKTFIAILLVLFLTGCSQPSNDYDDVISALHVAIAEQKLTINALTKTLDDFIQSETNPTFSLGVSENSTIIIIPTYDTVIEMPLQLPDYIRPIASEKGIAFNYMNDQNELELLMVVGLISATSYDSSVHTTVKRFTDTWQLAIIRQLDIDLSEVGKEKSADFLESIGKWKWK